MFIRNSIFRDPQRKIIAKSNEVVSAADGRVIAIEKQKTPFNKREAIKVSVFMNVFNVHSNKAPISGKVIKKIYKPGNFLMLHLIKHQVKMSNVLLPSKHPRITSLPLYK